jgi:glycerol kinase
MREQIVLAVDQGTSGTKVLMFDLGSNVVASFYKEHTQYYPKPGWVEHDPEEIWHNVIRLCDRAVKQVDPKRIVAMAITNQRETVVAWDRYTGKPLAPAIVWQCRRSADYCRDLISRGLEEVFRKKTGLPIDPYFSATKVQWLLDNIDGLRDKCKRGQVCIGTMDAWLLWNLTGRKTFATDYSNAARTLVFNINDLCWDSELLEYTGIPIDALPTPHPSAYLFGHTAGVGLLPDGIPIAGVIGDSQGALAGQACFEPGMAKATFGTGTSMMVFIGERPIQPPEGMVSTVAWGWDDTVAYAIEGIIVSTGATIQWLRDGLEIIPDAALAEETARKVEDNGGVYLVPAFAGLGAPYWDMDARALICGITRGTNRSHLVRAGLESIAYQVKDVTDLVYTSGDVAINSLRVDGGASSNELLMQFLSDILGIEVVKSHIEELSALGAVYMAGLCVGLWTKEDVARSWVCKKKYIPSMEPARRERLYAGWKTAVRRALTAPNTSS